MDNAIDNAMSKKAKYTNSQIIDGIAFGFSAAFLISAVIGALYSGEWGHVFRHWYRIMTTPGPLVTDYFKVGGLGSAFLNAGACGMAMFLFMALLKGESKSNTLAGYFLVVAHCFYGLNFLNMWPCFLAPFLYMKFKNLDYKSNLHICMFATSFAPFISEFLFRYTLGEKFEYGVVQITWNGVLYAILFAVAMGFIIPAILPGASAWHKGYNLFNGGMAFGVFGFFAFNFFYKSMGIPAPQVLKLDSVEYIVHNHSYWAYGNMFFVTCFLLCIIIGGSICDGNIEGVYHLFRDTGFRSDFAQKYGMAACLINIGIYGMMFLAYLNVITILTEGRSFTGPTFGVMLAALTFTAMGQHPRNVWPILVGYICLYLVMNAFTGMLLGRETTWTLSTQGYINGVAFATGMSPLVGHYGKRAGVLAGMICASMCTSTSAIHGGLVLYNGGFTAGLTVLILLPILEHYSTVDKRTHVKDTPLFNFEDMISLNEQQRKIRAEKKKKSSKNNH